MIRSFASQQTQDFYKGIRVKQFVNFATVAARKLAMLNAAVDLKDLRSPPGNRLEALSGNVPVNTVSGSMTSGVFVLHGPMMVR